MELSAAKAFTASDGEEVVAWDLSSYIPDRTSVPLCYSTSFIFCFGLTSPTGSATITDIGFYAEDELDSVNTGIKCVAVSDGDANGSDDGSVYSLQGVKMNGNSILPSGIYISGGKKVIVK